MCGEVWELFQEIQKKSDTYVGISPSCLFNKIILWLKRYSNQLKFIKLEGNQPATSSTTVGAYSVF